MDQGLTIQTNTPVLILRTEGCAQLNTSYPVTMIRVIIMSSWLPGTGVPEDYFTEISAVTAHHVCL